MHMHAYYLDSLPLPWLAVSEASLTPTAFDLCQHSKLVAVTFYAILLININCFVSG